MATRNSSAPDRPDALGAGAVLFRQALRGDGEKNQIVDAENDLEK